MTIFEPPYQHPISTMPRQISNGVNGGDDNNNNIGILAIQVYFPKQFVSQADLECHDASKVQISTCSSSTSSSIDGKYTTGLGQLYMAFCDPREEDAISLALTVVHKLLIDLDQNPFIINARRRIARIDVGTESNVDLSKGVKTHINGLLPRHCSGSDCVNACYGGTAALLNAMNWLESREYYIQNRLKNDVDVDLALVVMTDIAIYAPESPGRPTGGAGAVALLVGPGAPIRLGRHIQYYCENTFDFYRPIISSHQEDMYPVVDGAYSVQCYLKALQSCTGHFLSSGASKYDHIIMHCPYTKLVQKACKQLKGIDYERQAFPALTCCQMVGNWYTGSLYASLASLICHLYNPDDGADSGDGNDINSRKQILAFSYGSGLISCAFEMELLLDDESRRKWVKGMACQLNLMERLSIKNRHQCTPAEMDAVIYNYKRKGSDFTRTTEEEATTLVVERVKDVYYIDFVDEQQRRFYVLHQ